MLARLAILLGNIINDKSRAGSNPSKSLVSEVLMVSHSCGCGFVSNPRAGVYLGEKTFEVFLCFVATVRVGVYYVSLTPYKSIMLTSLYSYVTGEGYRFLHRGWAEKTIVSAAPKLTVFVSLWVREFESSWAREPRAFVSLWVGSSSAREFVNSLSQQISLHLETMACF